MRDYARSSRQAESDSERERGERLMRMRDDARSRRMLKVTLAQRGLRLMRKRDDASFRRIMFSVYLICEFIIYTMCTPSMNVKFCVP